MSGLARGAAETGAMNIWSGVIPSQLPWRESFIARSNEDGSILDLTGLTIVIAFRDCVTGSAVKTLSTTASTIVLETLTDSNGNSYATFRPAASDMTDMSGDYFGDIVMTDGSNVDHYWASGIITLSPHPVEGL